MLLIARDKPARARNAVLALLLVSLGACEGSGTFPEPIVTVEDARVRSPDQRLDAVITSERGAPSIGVVNYVFVVPAGAAITTADHPAVSARRVSPAFELRWAAPDLIELTYEKAMIQYFTNAVTPRTPAGGLGDVIELRLQARLPRAL